MNLPAVKSYLLKYRASFSSFYEPGVKRNFFDILLLSHLPPVVIHFFSYPPLR